MSNSGIYICFVQPKLKAIIRKSSYHIFDSYKPLL